MPIYDYACSACKRKTEVVHGINDEGPRFCPNCGADGTMTKSFSMPSVHFKGSGWAKKDRRPARAAAKDGGSENQPATAGEGKSTTPAAKDSSSTTSGTGGSSESSSKSSSPAAD